MGNIVIPDRDPGFVFFVSYNTIMGIMHTCKITEISRSIRYFLLQASHMNTAMRDCEWLHELYHLTVLSVPSGLINHQPWSPIDLCPVLLSADLEIQKGQINVKTGRRPVQVMQPSDAACTGNAAL